MEYIFIARYISTDNIDLSFSLYMDKQLLTIFERTISILVHIGNVFPRCELQFQCDRIHGILDIIFSLGEILIAGYHPSINAVCWYQRIHRY